MLHFSFGSGVVSERTGILLNDQMADFSIPGVKSYFNLTMNPNNYISPGKRPMSSMCPTILVDKDGDVKMTIGAAGGTKIPTAISLVRQFYFSKM